MNSAERWLGAAAIVVALSGMACTSGRSGSAAGGTDDGLRRVESGGSTAQETLAPGGPSSRRGQYGESSGFQPGRLDPNWKVESGTDVSAGAGTGGTMKNYTSATTGYGAGGAAGTTMGTYTSSTRGYGAGGAMTNYTSSKRGSGAGGTAPCP